MLYVFLLSALVVIFNYPSLRYLPDRVPDESILKEKGTSDMAGEFLPKWKRPDFYQNPQKYQDYKEVEIRKGEGKIQRSVFQSNRVEFRYFGNSQLNLLIKQFYFPGWKAKVDQKEIEVQLADDGRISLVVPKGTHQVKLYFGNTWIREASSRVSLISFFVLIFIVFLSYGRKYYFKNR